PAHTLVSHHPEDRPMHLRRTVSIGFTLPLLAACARGGPSAGADLGVGAAPPPGAEVLFDGTREMLDEKWTYWEGPRLASALPIKWQIVEDPVDGGTVLMTSDPAAAGGLYGAA